MHRLMIDLHDDVAAALQLSPVELAGQLMLAGAIHLHARGRLSLENAARVRRHRADRLPVEARPGS
jgi:hypothetical protein